MVVARSRSALHRARMVEGTEGSHHKEGSTKMSKHTMVCAGIDTGKRKLDVAVVEGSHQLQVANSPDGHTVLSAWLRQRRVKRVGIEATGGYEQVVVTTLRRDGFVVIVFQPAQVRAYAKFHLQRAKNDKIDAALIALCTADAPKIHAPPDPRLAPFAEHLTLIEQLTEDIAHVKTRRESCRDHRIRHHWNDEIARLKRLLRIELKALVAAIRQHNDLATRLDLIASVGGIGLKTARFWCACRRSAASPANKPQRWPAWLPMMMTARITSASVISKAVESGCEKASTPQPYRRHSIGILTSTSSTAD
jgi:transposase